MDNFFEQAALISKAHGYDVLADYVKELKELMREVITWNDNGVQLCKGLPEELVDKLKIKSL